MVSLSARRLNYRLDNACRDTIAQFCSEACPSMEDVDGQVCGGAVLHCLRDMQENITDADCKKEVFYFIKMEVKDFRNDVLLAEACRQDVQTFCDKVQPGASHLHHLIRCLACTKCSFTWAWRL
jgi:golgi apparatus protein 1